MKPKEFIPAHELLEAIMRLKSEIMNSVQADNVKREMLKVQLIELMSIAHQRGL